MKLIVKYKKQVAALLMLVMTIEMVTPTVAYGLTSGPSQPEMQGFEPIGNSDMVDLFTGDFSYNVPLLDVGGYPVNLAYHSGSGMDDEAGWVGYGWGLNVGSLNRQLRGIPDDFNGSDKQERIMNMKDHITTGGRFSMTLDLFGVPVPSVKKKRKKKKLNLSLTVSLGVKYDNYRGIGADIGVNPGVSLTEFIAGEKSNGVKAPDTATGKQFGSLDVGFNLSSFDGADVSVNSSILMKSFDQFDKSHSVSRSIGFGYNSRAGLTGMTLGSSFSTTKELVKNKGTKFEERFKVKDYTNSSSSSISFNGDTYTPTIEHPMRNNSYTFSLHLGPELFVALAGVGITGFYSKQKIAQTFKSSPSYGFLNSEKGKDENDALLDFNREKDIPYTPQIKYIPIPIPTYDLFSASSQDGGGQYRLYRGSSGVFFDQKTGNSSDNISVGIEAGAGAYFDIGADLYFQDIQTVTQKWRDRNKFLSLGDFQPSSPETPLYEPAYFKRVGEPVPFDNDYVNTIKGTGPTSVQLTRRVFDAVNGAEATNMLRTQTHLEGENTALLKRNKREVRNTTFSYLTAKEASNHGLEKTIKDYNPDLLVLNNCTTGGIKHTFSRVGDYRKEHHFSEITITGDDGKRSVYGIPVYNIDQQEVSFSSDQKLSLRNKGLIDYTASDVTTGNSRGRDNYYSREKTPPYTTSYLLTAILSPDFVDRTGNGVTDDDLGTAVKFNYTRLENPYNWRTPYAFGPDTANYNEGFLSDATDDKANYVFGQKEIWYLHSIESKTMVAQFVLADRLDALGVTGQNGAVNTTDKLKYLKEIRLFSKSDLQLNNNNPAATVPIKVVHFEYDYSICRGLPNSIGNKGKLTLKKVFFTFGVNQKGKLNPYEFKYDTSFNYYDYRQYDRWGNFKNVANNPNGLNNSEFPYTLQDTITNHFASLWQLNEIKLPSGGSIHVTYESDDYAYVQDKRASQMCFLDGVGSPGSSSGLIHANDIYVKLPYPVSSTKEMQERYFEGVDQLYYKAFLDLDGEGHSEFVPGYAKILSSERYNSTTAKIQLAPIGDFNPIAKAGWQFIRTSLPKYAYPGSENLEDNNTTVGNVLKALVTAAKTIGELFRNFNKRAEKNGFSNTLDLSKSWVRLCSPEWKKFGGGSRVKRIDISDDWAAMSGATGAKTATYTQVFDYTMKDLKGNPISSGVASYEPSLGNDENPFRQPINYQVNQTLGLDNYYYIEQPFGESFFPAASVGYSKVTVKSIGSGDDVSANRTGVSVSEFYTAKDYPTIVNILKLQQRNPGVTKLFKLVSNVSVNNVGLSQGYAIELNDMHGKPKSVQVVNKAGQEISSMKYFYQTANENAERKVLRNDVNVISPDGKISGGNIGMDVEIYTDMRQQTTNNLGISAKLSGGSGAILFFPLPFFFPGIGVNYDRNCYRAASTVKIIQRFGIQTRMRKIENGSSIETENLLWDAETGNVLLTKTQNEFDDPVYSFAYPAHWVYDGMAQAYQNLGTVYSGFTTNSNGEITNSVYNATLAAGDELIDINAANKYWVVSSPISSVYQKRLIDSSGNLKQVNSLTLKVLRSGRRNMANTGIATIASLNNPIVGDRLSVTQLTKILDAKATIFHEEWSVPVLAKSFQGLTGQNCISPASLATFFEAAISTQLPADSRKSIFASSTDNQTAGSAMASFAQQGGSLLYGYTLDNFWNGFPADSFSYFLHTQRNTTIGCTKLNQVLAGDTATLGNCKIIFDSVNNSTQAIIDYNNNMLIRPVGYTPACNACGGDEYRLINDSCGFTIKKVAVVTSGGCAHDSALYTVFKLHTACSPTTINGCLDPLGGLINPYYTGILGNWRPQSQFAYHISRENIPGDPAILGSTNIRKSGAYSVFNPFWRYNYSSPGWEQNPTADNRWIAASQVTYFNAKGLEVENKDALNRYSAALFGYLESLPVAVASNAQYREIGYDGFEDYGFTVDCAQQDTCTTKGHFNFNKLLNGSTIDRTTQYAHSGKYSLKVNGSATLNKTVYLGPSPSLFSFDNGRYILQSNELVKGFSPVPGKKYVLSFWVKDASPRDQTITIQASVNGTNLINNSTKWPIVEGWKRIEVQFVLSPAATGFSLQLQSGGGAVYFDDIRIHPFDAQLKSFAYDPSSQRLMAEMDENNFATFYEYDDEGILIRVKKETERGIMTIRETRSSYRKR